MNKQTVLIITSHTTETVTWEERDIYVRQFCEEIGGRVDGVRLLKQGTAKAAV